MDTINEPKILVSKRDAARSLSVCVRTIENLIRLKQLPARKIGRRTLIPARALQEFARRDHATRPRVADAESARPE